MRVIGDHYHIIEKLGQGGMGDVYRGVDTRTELPVAIKHLRGAISDDPLILERFRREGQALSDLNHPNIVKMLDMILHEGNNYLIMEYLDGGDLSGMLRTYGKLSVDQTLKMALELADALTRAHHLGIVHRDIKPANVLIAPDGTPRLTDFGVAHIESQERLTGTGMAVGTLDYLPPEAFNGEQVDFRADIWAFGVMLYEMLTGVRPFSGGTTMATITSILTEPAPDVRILCTEAPDALADLIAHMLQKERDDRIRSVRQVGASLEAILAGDKGGTKRFTPKTTPPTQKHLDDAPTTPGTPIHIHAETISAPAQPIARPSKMRWVVPLGGLLVVILGGLLFFPGGAFNPIIPTVTPTLQPTPTNLSITVGAMSEVVYDEVSLTIPSNWVPISVDTIIASVDTLFGGNPDVLTQVLNVASQQRSNNANMDLLNLTGLTVAIEDSLTFPDDVFIERTLQMGSLGQMPVVIPPEWVELPFGRALHVVFRVDFGIPIFLDIYGYQQDTTIYYFTFMSRESTYERYQPIFQDVINSVVISERTTTGNTPMSEIVYDDVRFSVPANWTTLDLDTIIEGGVITFGDEPEFLDRAMEYVDQQRIFTVNLDLLNFVGVAFMVEELMTLPEDALVQRTLLLADVANTTPISEPEWLDLPMGRTLHIKWETNWQNTQMFMDMYSTQKNGQWYSWTFVSRQSTFERFEPIFEAVRDSIIIEAPTNNASLREVVHDGVRFTVPSNWATLDFRTLRAGSEIVLAGNEALLEQADNFYEQQRIVSLHFDLLNFVGVLFLVEPMTSSSDEAVLQRAFEIAEMANATPLTEPEWLDLPMGRTLHIVWRANWENANIVSDAYAMHHNGELYTFMFASRPDNLERHQPAFDAVINSVAIDDTVVRVTPAAIVTATPTIEPTQSATNGMSEIVLSEVRLSVPSNWIPINPLTILEGLPTSITDGESVQLAHDFAGQQRIYSGYLDMFSLVGMVIAVEDNIMNFSDELFAERTLLTAGEAVIEPEWIEIPAGRALHIIRRTTWDTAPVYTEGYALQINGTTYQFIFVSRESTLERFQPIFDTVRDSIVIGAQVPIETTPEATIELGIIPDDWRYSQGEYSAIALPRTWAVSQAGNTGLFNSLTNLFLGNTSDGESISALFNQMTIELMTMQMSADNLFVMTVAHQVSPIPVTLDVASDLVSELFENMSFEGVTVDHLELIPVSLPVGDTTLMDIMITTSTGAFTNLSYIVVAEDGMSVHVVSFLIFTRERESQMPIIEAIIETFRIIN